MLQEKDRSHKKKILFAVGGTGGHLFPAQALAREIRAARPEIDILFAGGRLSTNPFFAKQEFPFVEVVASSPYVDGYIRGGAKILRGTGQSLKLLKEYAPDLIIGFGSFYSFPLLVASRIKKIPYLLVETNAHPGKVNRLFSKQAACTLLQFEEAAALITGKVESVQMPLFSKEPVETKEEARIVYGLEPSLYTLLIFGGSAGAKAINQAALRLDLPFPYQVIHLAGHGSELTTIENAYREKEIPAVVKAFEPEMGRAWKSADLVICRSGAGTLTEIVNFQVPAILIPWPGSADQHQRKNAEILEKKGGAILLPEEEIEQLAEKIVEIRKKSRTMCAQVERLLQKNRDLCSFVLDTVLT